MKKEDQACYRRRRTTLFASILTIVFFATACSSSTERAAGANQTIKLNSGLNVEVFVPDGWYLGDMEDTGTISENEEDDIYYLANSDILPKELMAAAEEDIESRDHISELFGQGGAISIGFSPVQSCVPLSGLVEELVDQFSEGGTEVAVEADENGIGDEGTMISARTDSLGLTRYMSSVPAGNGSCQALWIEGWSVSALSELRAQVEEVAQHSVIS